ncbi:MAG: anhydro-N-acetylmuramic acid kinase [Acidobacteriia bacterium]|nr:anhydro-N-acetylmuramic acid kinase [Terriglobia bacterium]
MKRIIGLMSGTSVDGIDVAVVDVSGNGPATRFCLRAFENVSYRPSDRRRILSFLTPQKFELQAISQLNFWLGSLFAEAVLKVCRKHHIDVGSVDLIGSHGQTIYHQSIPSLFEGRPVASTLQLGEAAVIAERTGVTTISDFRVRDVAAGGTGAPLVPYVDFLLLRDEHKNRVALNIGGIANVTCLPRRVQPHKLIAFDTGPGNMIIDAATALVTRRRMRFDRDGRLAASGRVNERVLKRWMSHPFYRLRPPKAAGREQFGVEYTREIARDMRRFPHNDLIATATELTARTIVLGIQRFGGMRGNPNELIVSGGGARNKFLLTRLRALLPASQAMTSNAVGIDLDAKEAIAFAILANETWHGRTSNVPSVTGAHHEVILGKITPA